MNPKERRLFSCQPFLGDRIKQIEQNSLSSKEVFMWKLKEFFEAPLVKAQEIMWQSARELVYGLRCERWGTLISEETDA